MGYIFYYKESEKNEQEKSVRQYTAHSDRDYLEIGKIICGKTAVGRKYISRVYNQTINRYQANECRLIYASDYNNPPYNMYLLTAYPDIKSTAPDKIDVPEEQMLADIRKTRPYQKADKMHQAFYDYHAFEKNPEYGWALGVNSKNVLYLNFNYKGQPHKLAISEDRGCTLVNANEKAPKPNPDLTRNMKNPFKPTYAEITESLCGAFPDNQKAFKAVMATISGDQQPQQQKTAAKTPELKAAEYNPMNMSSVKKVMNTANNLRESESSNDFMYH